MRRRSSTPTVTLFPFLAVLVCTMGSLILLLLVTTRKIRHQAEIDLKSGPVQMAAPALMPPAPDPEAVRAAHAYALAVEEREQEIAARQAAYRQALAQREQDLQRRHSQWQAQLAAMSDRNSQLSQQAAQLRGQIDAESAAMTTTDSEQQKLASLISTAADQGEQLKSSESQLQDQAFRLIQERESVRKQIEEAKVQNALRKPRVQIVAWDGNSGTERRPILIECRADGLTFASEHIDLSAETLDKFSPEQNPLLAGTEALLGYWTLVDTQQQNGAAKPYVLLIVRPGGTIGFYVARKYLEKLGQDFGYELVSVNDELQWPDPDPQAVEICRAAVERSLKEEPLVRKGGGGFNGGGRGHGVEQHEQIVDSSGNFHLDEVEQLRRAPPGENIGMLGSEWNRSARNSAGGSGEGGQANGQSGAALGATGRDAGLPPEARPGAGRSTPRMGADPTAASRFTQAAARERSLSGSEKSGNATSGTKSGQPSSSTGSGQPANGAASGQSASSSTAASASRSAASAQEESSSSRPPELPPEPFSQDKLKEDGGTRRQWGKAQRGSAIGIEREVVLQIYPDKIEILDDRSLELTPEMGRPEFQAAVAEMLQAHAMTWGEPPGNFTWRPVLKVKIHPGGNQHYPRLKELIQHWGLSSRVEQVLD